MIMDVKEYITKGLLTAMKDSGIKINPNIVLKKSNIYGDIYTPIALGIAKELKSNPYSLALKIMSHFPWDQKFVTPDPSLEKTITGPGFINFYLV